VIEAECAALAAKSAKRTQVQAIADALDEMDQEMAAGREPLPCDRLFHLRIAEATGNGALVHVIKLLWDERTGPLFSRLEHHYDSPGLWQTAMSEHRKVLESIAAHDPDAARAAMQRHLDHAYKRFSKGWNARTSSDAADGRQRGASRRAAG
jgi:DNA-binding FadR family transcriptional regulator